MMRLKITPVDKKIIEDALNLLATRQNVNGKFEMIDYTYDYYYSPYFETSTSRDVRYTCFTLLAFLTNRDFVTKDYSNVINKAFAYFEYINSMENYAAAVCAYAASLYNPTKARSLLITLEKNSYTDGIDRYWDNVKSNYSSSCIRMQISSYVALAYIKLGDYLSAKQIINWLLKQRQANGEFCYQFTSAIGFEALSEYAAYYGIENTDMEVKVETEAKLPKTTRVNNSNAKDVQVLILPNNNHRATVTGTGYGFAQVQLHYSYSKNVAQLSSYFIMDVKTTLSNISTVNVCVRKQRTEDKGDILLEMNLPSGYTYLAENSNPMAQFPSIVLVKNNLYFFNFFLKEKFFHFLECGN